MPRCGPQIVLCDLPIRFDTYKGCSHGCKYCFVTRKTDISVIGIDESVESLRKFISGERTRETCWCDWNIPLHWGGMSDPFQPCELDFRQSLKCLELFAETKYPFVVSTKGTSVLRRTEYLELLEKCNAVVQVSLVSPKFDKLEPGAPPFPKRLEDIAVISKAAKRLIIRIQPYIREVRQDIITALPCYKNAGVYGITIEGIKYLQKRPGMVKVGGDFVYPVEKLKADYAMIRDAAHDAGLKFFCAENRLRPMGDSLCCCGIDDAIEGFKTNKANVSHYLYDNPNFDYTRHQTTLDSATSCFKSLAQDSVSSSFFQSHSYAEVMNILIKDKRTVSTMQE